MKRVRRVLLAALLVWTVLSVLAGEILMHPPRWSPPRLADVPRLLGEPELRTEPLAFELDGLRIAGWLLEPPARDGEPRGTLLALHGLGEARRLVDHRMVLRLGWRVLAVDTRAHGDSEGWAAGFGWSERAEARALLELAQQRWPDAPRVAWGRSQGAAAFLYALHELGDAPAAALDGLVIESCYADIDTAYTNRLEVILGGPEWRLPMLLTQAWTTWRAGLDRARMRPVELLPDGPELLFARGAEDPLVGDAEWARFLAAAPDAEHVLVSGRRHEPLGEVPQFAARVTALLARCAER